MLWRWSGLEAVRIGESVVASRKALPGVCGICGEGGTGGEPGGGGGGGDSSGVRGFAECREARGEGRFGVFELSCAMTFQAMRGGVGCALLLTGAALDPAWGDPAAGTDFFCGA